MIGAWPGLILAIGGMTFFAPMFEGGTTQIPFSLIRLAAIVSCGLWLVCAVKNNAATFRWGTISQITIAFVSLAMVSFFWAPYKQPAVQWILTLLIYAWFLQMVLEGVRGNLEVCVLVSLVLGVGLFEGVLGLAQCAWLGAYRASGTFFNPNFFATYQAGILALTSGILCFAEKRELRRNVQVLLWLVGIISFGAILMARSRGAALAVVPVMAFIGLVRFGRATILAVLACVLLIALVPNPIRERVLEISAHDPFAYTRVDIWENSLSRIKIQPWGIGLGMYKYASFQSRFPIEGEIARFGKRAETAHNEYLQIAVELGILGIALFSLGTLVWLKEARRTFCEEQSTLRRGAIIGLIGVVATVLIHAAVDSVFHEPALVLLMILAAGLVLAIGRNQRGVQEEATEGSFRYTTGRAVIAGLVLLVLSGLTIQPAAAWYAFEQGNRSSSNGEHGQALIWYQRATMVEPWNAAYHSAVASSHVALFQASGDSTQVIGAVDELNLSMSLNPLDGRFPYRTGTLYQLLGEHTQIPQERVEFFRQASSAYRLATEKDPFSPFNYDAMASIQVMQGDLTEAKQSLATALEFEPNYLPARALRMKLFIESGDLESAMKDYEEIRSRKRRYEAKVATPMERQFLGVDLERLEQLVKR